MSSSCAIDEEAARQVSWIYRELVLSSESVSTTMSAERIVLTFSLIVTVQHAILLLLQLSTAIRDRLTVCRRWSERHRRRIRGRR